MKIVYAGIGARKSPGDMASLMRKIGAVSALLGYEFRSGHALGADTYFEEGVLAVKSALMEAGDASGLKKIASRIYLPWEGFNGGSQKDDCYYIQHPDTKELVFKYHSGAKNLTRGPFAMMRRNCHQVLGDDLNSKANYVICWTADGSTHGDQTSRKTGGTGMAIRLASAYGVPVFNLRNIEHRKRLKLWVQKHEASMSIGGKTIQECIDTYLLRHLPGKVVQDDLVKMSKNGSFDVIVHGCNCQNKMGSGLAKSIRDTYPQAYEADCQTRPGDRSKLGKFTSATVDRPGHNPLTIINAYTQFRYSRREEADEPSLDYDAVKKFCKLVVSDYPEMIRGKKIGLPKIGVGLAGGDWPAVAKIFKDEWSPYADITVVDFDDAAMEPECAPKASEQGELGF